MNQEEMDKHRKAIGESAEWCSKNFPEGEAAWWQHVKDWADSKLKEVLAKDAEQV